MKEKIVYPITIEEIQMNAESNLGRELTKSELEDVVERMYDDNWGIVEFINESIEYVIDYNDLIKRNKNADKNPHHFRTYWKNPNAYREEFQLSASFKNIDDAKKFIKSFHDLTEFDTWRITEFKEGMEKEVEIITLKSHLKDDF